MMSIKRFFKHAHYLLLSCFISCIWFTMHKAIVISDPEKNEMKIFFRAHIFLKSPKSLQLLNPISEEIITAGS